MKNMEEPATQKILKSTARTKINTEYTQWIAKQQKIGKKGKIYTYTYAREKQRGKQNRGMRKAIKQRIAKQELAYCEY